MSDNDSRDDTVSPFILSKSFPDAQGLFDTQYRTLEEIKNDCFVALDANVLLLPYKFENVALPDVIAAYKPLVDQKRLIIPAQAAREFAKHRSNKVADVVKHLREEASHSGPRLTKKIGALSGNDQYENVRALAVTVSSKIKELQNAINALADDVASNIGDDPVSIAYRKLFCGVVRENPESCCSEKEFLEELAERYKTRRPPGYKDGKKPDAGAGDLLIWKTIIAEGVDRKTDCIFVTADEKADWYVQSVGPFQPRLELLEEYRAISGHTIHILPLSRLLRLFKAKPEAVENVQLAESYQSSSLANRASELLRHFSRSQEYEKIKAELNILERDIDLTERSQQSLPSQTGNLSLPWERAQAAQLTTLRSLLDRRASLKQRLEELRAEQPPWS